MTFVVATRKLEQLPHWVKVSDVFKSDNNVPFMKRAGVSDFDDPRCEKYTKRLMANCVIFVNTSIVWMCWSARFPITRSPRFFVRVNSLGAKLRSSDLALAQITAKWRHSLQTFLDFRNDCKLGFDLELGIHLRNLIVFATEQSRFLTVGNLSVEKLKTSWTASCGDEVCDQFLEEQCWD